MNRVVVSQLTVDRLTGRQADRFIINYICGTERLRVVVNKLTVDLYTYRQVNILVSKLYTYIWD